MSGETWLMMDFEAGECELAQVGSPKKLADAPDEDMTASERLKRDALVAYKSLGGPEYLKRNPELLDKALLKMIAEPEKKTETEVRIVVDAPWLSSDRLSYQREVIDLTPNESKPEGWRPEDSRTHVERPMVKANELLPPTLADPRSGQAENRPEQG